MDEIGAAAEEDVLAIVHNFAGAGMFIGGGASAHVGAALKESDLNSDMGERAACGEAGETTADDSDIQWRRIRGHIPIAKQTYHGDTEARRTTKISRGS